MREIMLVAGREYREKGLKKSMIISTVVIVALMLLGGGAAHIWLADKIHTDEVPTVVVAEEAVSFADQFSALNEQGDLGYRVQMAPADEVEDLVREGSLDSHSEDVSYAVVAGVVPNTRGGVDIVADGSLAEKDTQILFGAAQSYVMGEQVKELGGNPMQFQTALAKAMPQVRDVSGEKSGFDVFENEDFDAQQYLMGMVTISLILFATMIGSQLVMAGVVEEKTSRVVEVLLATIRPSKLLAGKILGIGALVLTQMGIIAAAALAAMSISGLGVNISIPIGPTLGWMIVWFAIGYALSSVLFGAGASLVSRQEELGAISFPFVMVSFIPFYMAMYMVPMAPEATVTRVCSYIPLFSSYLMPMRIAFGSAEIWEVALSLALALGALPVFIWLAGRIYQRAVLHTGGRMKLKDALFG